VPPALQEEIDYWLYHLSRQRQHWRVRAERYLKALGPVVIGPVTPFTQHDRRPEWLVRCAALRIVAAAKHPASVPVLWDALSDPHPTVRKVAHEGLVKVTGNEFRADLEDYPKLTRKRWTRYLRARDLLPPERKE
jgi:hypothetical protein